MLQASKNLVPPSPIVLCKHVFLMSQQKELFYRERHHLTEPSSEELAKFISMCLTYEPEERPSFRAVLRELTEMMMKSQRFSSKLCISFNHLVACRNQISVEFSYRSRHTRHRKSVATGPEYIPETLPKKDHGLGRGEFCHHVTSSLFQSIYRNICHPIMQLSG